jgi:thiamine biosynthesis protein ThiI
MDKTEITALARQIATYETSILPYQDCCSLFLPRHPATRPALRETLQAEALVEWQPLLENAFNTREVINLAASLS